jgi:hypothetical protein
MMAPVRERTNRGEEDEEGAISNDEERAKKK